MDRVKRIWYLSHMRAAKVQASLRIRAVSPEPPLLAHTSIESRGTFRQKTRSLAPLNGWACAVKICHDGMLEDTKSLDAAHIITNITKSFSLIPEWYMSHLMTKSTKWHMSPAKTQISFGFHPESLLCAWRKLGPLHIRYLKLRNEIHLYFSEKVTIPC